MKGLEKLMPVTEFSQITWKGETLKRAEMLVTETGWRNGQFESKDKGLRSNFDGYFFHRGLTSRGVPLRTKKMDYHVDLHGETDADKVNEIMTKERESVPGAGKVVPVFWYSKDTFPWQYLDERYVSLLGDGKLFRELDILPTDYLRQYIEQGELKFLKAGMKSKEVAGPERNNDSLNALRKYDGKFAIPGSLSLVTRVYGIIKAENREVGHTFLRELDSELEDLAERKGNPSVDQLDLVYAMHMALNSALSYNNISVSVTPDFQHFGGGERRKNI